MSDTIHNKDIKTLRNGITNNYNSHALPLIYPSQLLFLKRSTLWLLVFSLFTETALLLAITGQYNTTWNALWNIHFNFISQQIMDGQEEKTNGPKDSSL